MRPILSVLCLVLIAAALPLVAAQDDTRTAPSENATDQDCAQIDHLTELCSAEVVDGTAILELTSERRQSIVITDVGPMMDGGGQIPQHNVILDEGTNTVEVPITQPDGYAAVTVATNEALYGEVIEDDDDPLIGGPWTHRDVQLAALLALLVGVSSVPIVSRVVDSQLQEDRLV